mmetsp:Transcript_13506/g.34643  ORF Transcript_13506/g.34643 Transcript_13506/m.34643 type:complete len:204 (+) Transcript_13506:501-1112(+)
MVPYAPGPYERVPLERTPVWSDAISRQCAEGPTLVPLRASEDSSGKGASYPGSETLAGGWLLLYDGYRTDCALLWGDKESDHRTGGRSSRETCAKRSGLRIVPDLSEARLAPSFTEAEHPRCIYMGAGGFGALHSADLRTWRDVSAEVNIPRNHKHGTAVRLPRASICQICKARATDPDILLAWWEQLDITDVCRQRAACAKP